MHLTLQVVSAECGDVIESEKMHILVEGYVKLYRHRRAKQQPPPSSWTLGQETLIYGLSFVFLPKLNYGYEIIIMQESDIHHYN